MTNYNNNRFKANINRKPNNNSNNNNKIPNGLSRVKSTVALLPGGRVKKIASIGTRSSRSAPTLPTVNALNILYNATEFFYNINIPPNFLTLGYIDIELECPSQTTSAIDFITSNPLANLYINLVIVDEDPQITNDTILAPPIDMKNYNTGHLPIKMF